MKALFLILGLGFFGWGWSQEKLPTFYEVQYDVEFSMDTTDLAKKSNEVLYLYTGKEYGVFMNYTQAHMDQIRADFEHQIKTTGQINIDKKLSSDFPKKFYKELRTGTVKTLEKIGQKNYIFEEPETPLAWHIEDSIQELQGYTVQKATTHFAGRDYEAWFTTEIPLTDGPYVFGGLPGLIVTLNDVEHHYQFTLKSIEKMADSKTFEIPKSQAIGKSDFEELKKEFDKNRTYNVVEMGSIQIEVVDSKNMSAADKMDNKALKKRIKENRARKNNPIERL